jgi:hypothetical protein
MSLEYSMFRFSDDYPTADGLSDMIMQVCMDNTCESESVSRLIRSLVRAAHELRWLEAIGAGDEDEVDIPEVPAPGELYLECYARACRAIGEHYDGDDEWWEDWWPTDCPWHPDDIARLSRLRAGATQSLRRQLRSEFAKHKEAEDSKAHSET